MLAINCQIISFRFERFLGQCLGGNLNHFLVRSSVIHEFKNKFSILPDATVCVFASNISRHAHFARDNRKKSNDSVCLESFWASVFDHTLNMVAVFDWILMTLSLFHDRR